MSTFLCPCSLSSNIMKLKISDLSEYNIICNLNFGRQLYFGSVQLNKVTHCWIVTFQTKKKKVIFEQTWVHCFLNNNSIGGFNESSRNENDKLETYRWGLNNRLILGTCSFSQSRSSSPWSMLNLLLQGLIGGGPVLWLVAAADMGRDCILGSPRSAASPREKAKMNDGTKTGTLKRHPL